MLIFVVHNATHHADNLLRLVEDITVEEGRTSLAVFCESKDAARLRATVRNPTTRVVTWSKPPRSILDATGQESTGAVVNRLSNAMIRLLSVYLRLRQMIKGKSKLGDWIVDVIEYNSLSCVLRRRRVQRRYAEQIREAHRVLEQLQPDLVVAWGDRHLDLELPALVAAKQRNLKVLLPYVSFSHYRILLWSRRMVGEPKQWVPFSLYRLIANMRLPGMVREGYFFQEPHVLFALKQLNALSKNPWTIGCGHSDVVCVDNAITFARYQAEGVPAEKLRIVGSAEFDSLHRGLASRATLRRHLAERYKLAIDRKLIVIALPQFAEQGVLPWDRHWVEIKYILAQLSKTGLSILVSLHPRVAYDDYRCLEQDFNVKLLIEPLKEALPAADVFVAANSSTLTWAVLCGVKSFMLDFYGLDSSEFAKFRSIVQLRNRETLHTDLVAGLVAETDFSDDWMRLSRSEVFDGKVIERYRELVRGLAEMTPCKVSVKETLHDGI